MAKCKTQIANLITMCNQSTNFRKKNLDGTPYCSLRANPLEKLYCPYQSTDKVRDEDGYLVYKCILEDEGIVR